ncbi:YlzJ-like family protein [Robertmurraya mangrovi]|nr:YlzJ-like family protein [Bacillus sp. 31A1R]
MILYTTMPQELIFQGHAEENKQEQMMMHYEGIPVLVERDEDHSYRVVRVMSTDPAHYLNEKCCPGSKISFP